MLNSITPEKINIISIRADFPILQQKINGKPLVYLDNAATTQKPLPVMDAMHHYYLTENANVHRGIHQLADRATEAYENARKTVQQFIHAKKADEIVFVKGATEAINLVAQCYGFNHIQAGDEILISQLEHHSNWVPWQIVCQKTGAQLRVIPLTPQGEIDQIAFETALNPRVKLLALNQVSHVLGTRNPVADMIKKARAYGIPVLIDGTQAVPHLPVDVQALNCDFYVFSGHKLYGPTGIGVLYAKEKWLEKMPPYQTGGGMIEQVSLIETTYQSLAKKFEAGTPNVAGAVGLAAAIHYLNGIGFASIQLHEKELLAYAEQQLSTIADLAVIGQSLQKTGLISFVMKTAHPHDIATILDSAGVAIRAGHHCAMPLMHYLQLPATARVSFGLYNTREEIDGLIAALEKVREIFA